MGGFLLLFGFLFCGTVTAHALFRNRSGLIRCWLGLCLGLGMMMWFPALFAYIMDFNAAAQFCGIGAAVLCAVAAHILCRKKTRYSGPFCGKIPAWLIAVLVLPLLAFSAYLQFTHMVRNVEGVMYVGQSTYGDLCLHMGIATGAVNAPFPPDYTILYGAKLGYPFLADTMVSSMLLFGMDISAAFSVTGTLMMGLVYVGFIIFAWELAPGKGAVAISFVLMFLNGGLGFLYVLDGAAADPSMLQAVFTDYYRAPANMPDLNLRWVNVICDMMIPQRTLLAGWMMLLPAVYLLLRAMKEKSLFLFVCVGIWAGAMPLVHTHSFLALGILSAGAMAWALFTANRRERASMLYNFAAYGFTAVALALPQLAAYTFPQTIGGGSLQFWFNWVNNNGNGLIDDYLWFWIKNVGIVYLLMVPAAVSSSKSAKAFALGALLIYLIAELIVFQPNKYDNNKLFYVAFMVMLPMVGKYCAVLWKKLSGVPGRAFLAVLFIGVSTLSGAMSLGREAVSQYMLFGSAEVEAAEFAQNNTQRDAVFLTGEQHNNAIAALSGRQIICGTGSYLYYHGLDYYQQKADQRLIYENPAENLHLINSYGIDYIYVSDHERGSYYVDETYFQQNFTTVFNKGRVRIYKVTEVEMKGDWQ